MLGRSELGRPIYAIERGSPRSPRKLLVVGCIHGTECAGTAIVRLLGALPAPRQAQLWLIPNLNPDGLATGTRLNGRGVDLNRNFPSQWRRNGSRWSPEYPGPRPASERETRIAMNLVLRLRPQVSIWYHQPQGLVRAWGGSVWAGRRYAVLAGLPYRSILWLAGTAPNWQNHRFPGAASFVVELPPGPLPAAVVRRHAQAVLALAG